MHQQPNPPAVQITDYLHSHPDCSPDILFCAEVIVAVHITAGDSQHQGGDRAACQADFTGIGAAAPSHCGSYKGKGYGKLLMEYCLADAKIGRASCRERV